MSQSAAQVKKDETYNHQDGTLSTIFINGEQEIFQKGSLIVKISVKKLVNSASSLFVTKINPGITFLPNMAQY